MLLELNSTGIHLDIALLPGESQAQPLVETVCHNPLLQEYAQYREEALESNYNLGRAAHHLGLVHVAVQYYHKCLNSKPHGASVHATEEGSGVPMHNATLRREAAFNLSLILRGAGADELARQVLQQHVTI